MKQTDILYIEPSNTPNHLQSQTHHFFLYLSLQLSIRSNQKKIQTFISSYKILNFYYTFLLETNGFWLRYRSWSSTMASMTRFMLLMTILLSVGLSSSHAQTCSNYKFSRNQIFRACNDLPFLNSYLHWNYDSSTSKLQVAYRHTGVSSSRWVAWAINPSSGGMVGSQALVAYQNSDGTMRAYTSPITGYQTTLDEGKLSFDVSDLSATYANNEIIIFATLEFSNMSSTLNQVWQDGPVSGNAPQIHSTSGPNVQSMATVNLLSGEARTTSGGNDKTKKRNVSLQILC